MNKQNLRPLIASLLTVLGFAVSTGFAQTPAAPVADVTAAGTHANGRPRTSPHATTSNSIDRALISISYGRPFTIKPGTTLVRKIWGGQVKWEQADRLGADEATLLVTPKPLLIAGTTVPAGSYTLYIVPSETGTSKLAFSKNIGKWGIPVDEKNDVARFDLKKETLTQPVDQLTIWIAKEPSDNSGVIKIAWELTQFSLPFAIAK